MIAVTLIRPILSDLLRHLPDIHRENTERSYSITTDVAPVQFYDGF